MSGGSARVVGGRYRLSGWLGRGGMGAVWEAHDTLLGRDVALKEIYLPDDSAGPDDPMIRRAFREAQAAARLRHRGIVTVHDVVTEDGRPWIVMELIDGPSLAAAVREHGTLAEHRVADIGLQVLDALRAAHRQGVLHRDVKPANILLGTDRVVLTDFGIAAIDDATSITSTGQMIGSPAFLAPERINGQPATAATDLWALGVTLYTAVTGRSPFPGEDLPGTLAAILNRTPEPPAGADLLWPVIEGLLAKDPDRRLTADLARPLLSAAARAHSDQPGAAAHSDQPGATVRSGQSGAAGDSDRRPFSGPQLPPTLREPSPPFGAPSDTDPHDDRLTAPVPPGDRTDPHDDRLKATVPPGDRPVVRPVSAAPAAEAGSPGANFPAGSRSPSVPAHPGWGPGAHPGAVHAPQRAFPWQVVWIALLVVSTLAAAGAIIRTTWLQLDGSAAPTTGTSTGDRPSSSTGTPPASSTPSSEPSQAVPSTFIGEWSGTAKQPIGTVSSWDLVITFTATSRTGSFFTSLNCTGTLTVVAPWPTDREIHLHQQTGWNPRQTCVDEADITLTLDDDGRMEMRWQDLGNASNQATASLTRS
jgi:serine/threonine protein kinase